MRHLLLICLTILSLSTSTMTNAASTDLGNGFRDHGVAVPISNHRGAACTVDGEGRNVVLSWLMDHRGGYELLMVDAETGKTQEFPLPFLKDVKEFDAPYTVLLSSKNKFYTHLNSYFIEFDPTTRQFTCSQKTTPQMGMCMTEDDKGVIWSVSHPDSAVCSWDPATKKFRDYGSVYKQNWKQYPRYVAADDAGWIYFAVGNTASQIIALDPESGKATPILKEEERKKGISYVYRDTDGKVYGSPLGQANKENWMELYKGSVKKLESHEDSKPKKYLTGPQTFFHMQFPDGKVLKTCDLVNRKIVVEDPKTNKTIENDFDYQSDGAIVMGVCASPDGKLAGGSAFPMHTFWLDPKADTLGNRAGFGQWNAIQVDKDHYYVGVYPGGSLLEWMPTKPWVQPVKDKEGTNPLVVRSSDPDVHRPTCVYPHPDGKTVILAGTPDYGYTGGGLLFWNRESNETTLIGDKDLIPDQSTESIIALPNEKLLGTTTTSPGTGGEKKAKEAEFYVMDFATRKIEWHAPLIPGAQEIADLHPTGDGKFFSIVDRKMLIVFDPAKREVVYKKELDKEFGPTSYQQGPRIFVDGANGALYVLFVKGIATLDPKSYELKMVAESPKPVESGGDFFDGKIYFVSGSHICSWQVK